MIEGEAVGAVGFLAENGQRAAGRVVVPNGKGPLVDLFAAQIAEQQKADAAANGAFGEAEAACQLAELGAAVDEVEQVVLLA